MGFIFGVPVDEMDVDRVVDVDLFDDALLCKESVGEIVVGDIVQVRRKQFPVPKKYFLNPFV